MVANSFVDKVPESSGTNKSKHYLNSLSISDNYSLI